MNPASVISIGMLFSLTAKNSIGYLTPATAGAGETLYPKMLEQTFGRMGCR